MATRKKGRVPMQTVNFHCPHCGNLMAVGTNLLGRNVRCPHCKQVVRAPAAAGDAPAPPVVTPAPPPRPTNLPAFDVARPTETYESIFGERHDEDVFGSEPPRPKMPDAPPDDPPPSPAPPTPMTVGETATVAMSAPPDPPGSPTDFGATFGPSAALNPVPEPPAAPPTEDRVSAYRARPTREPAAATPAFAWILLVYAGLATVAAGFFGYQYFMGASAPADHPYKAIPDFYGQYQKADRRQLAVKGLPDSKLGIPADLRVKLGEELAVGDLKVTPLSVEQEKIVIVTEQEVGAPSKSDAGQTLVLRLRVKNLSTDTVFDPADPAFRRARKDGQPLPYTALQIGHTFYYGPFPWPPESGVTRYFVDGQDTEEKRLGPGEERDTWITAAPRGLKSATDDVIRDVADLKKQPTADPLLWRVQLRRGLVKVKDDAGQDVDISATTVIGVEFTPDQIRQ